jgi:hypothetical protein
LVGWIKTNWDASLDKNGKQMGVGILVRDQGESVLAAKCVTKPLITNQATAEAIGAWLSAELGKQLVYPR